MLVTLIVIIGLSLLILGHEAGHFFAAKLFGLKVDEFGFGFPPRMFSKKRGETEYSFNWLPFGGFVKIAGEHDPAPFTPEAAPQSQGKLFNMQSAWKKSAIILAGVIVNFLLGWLLISAVLMIGTPSVLVISGTQANTPASGVFKEGDAVKGFVAARSFIDYIDAHRGQPTQITIQRDGKTQEITVTPRKSPPAGEGALGVYLEEGGTARESFFQAVRDGLFESITLVWFTLQGFWELFKNLFIHASLAPGVVGPVGIFSVAQQTGKLGLAYLLQLISLISINLAVVNLIPFPALDGGRFVLIVVEKIKGSPLPRHIEGWINGIGLAFLILLMIFLTIRDVSHLL